MNRPIASNTQANDTVHDDAAAALAALWRGAGLPPEALAHAELPGAGPVLPSSFAVTAAAQASLAAAALAAAEIWHARHPLRPRQQVRVPAEAAALECLCWFTLDGRAPPMWDKLSGLYPCGSATGEPGHVRLHANFAHHRDGALRLMGLPEGAATERAAVAQALQHWRAEDFETAAAEAGLVVAAARSFAQWDAHPQGVALAEAMRDGLPFSIERIEGTTNVPPRRWPEPAERPLQGLRVLELTRILAGPVAGRTLAAYGADVMLVNAPHLPNIEALPDTSRGKLSAHVDLNTPEGRDTLAALMQGAHVFLQSYRPNGLASRGFGPLDAARLSPGIVVASLSAYGPHGPWRQRRGFDSLVQTATGFNLAEAQAFGVAEPKPMPAQILDYGAGFLLAFALQAALLRQAREGGSWHVQVSLAGVARWLRSLGRTPQALQVQRPPVDPYVERFDSGFGALMALRHPAEFSATPARWDRPSVPPGTNEPRWP